MHWIHKTFKTGSLKKIVMLSSPALSVESLIIKWLPKDINVNIICLFPFICYQVLQLSNFDIVAGVFDTFLTVYDVFLFSAIKEQHWEIRLHITTAGHWFVLENIWCLLSDILSWPLWDPSSRSGSPLVNLSIVHFSSWVNIRSPRNHRGISLEKCGCRGQLLGNSWGGCPPPSHT